MTLVGCGVLVGHMEVLKRETIVSSRRSEGYLEMRLLQLVGLHTFAYAGWYAGKKIRHRI